MGQQGKKPLKLPPRNSNPLWEMQEFYVEHMSDAWFDDCQTQWGLSVDSDRRDDIRELVRFATALKTILPTPPAKKLTRELEALAKHSRKLVQAILLLDVNPDLETDMQLSCRRATGWSTFYALICSLDPEYSDPKSYLFPKSIPKPPPERIKRFIIDLMRFSRVLETLATNRLTESERRKGSSKTSKRAEKGDREFYLDLLSSIFRKMGGKIEAGRGVQLSSFECFVTDVVSKIPCQSVREYYEAGLDTAIRTYLKSDRGPIITGSRLSAWDDLLLQGGSPSEDPKHVRA
jgi:hypothetical protein